MDGLVRVGSRQASAVAELPQCYPRGRELVDLTGIEPVTS